MKKIYLGLLILLFFISFSSATSSFFVEKSTDYDIKFSCELGGAVCPVDTSCNLTIQYPNSTILINNNATTNLNNGYFNFTLNENQTSTNGEYSMLVYCSSGGLNDSTNIIYEVNPPGMRSTDQKVASLSVGIYFFLIIAIILFISFLFSKSSLPLKWTFFILSILFFLVSINLIFINIQDQVINSRLEGFFEGFTVISWYIFYFLAIILILLWGFAFINTWVYKKQIQQINKYGLDG